MAKVSAFQFTNTSAGQHPVGQVALGLTTNYALIQDEADVVILSNKTTPIDAEERIALRSRTVTKIGDGLNIQYPSPIKGGIEYSVKVEDTLTTTDTADATFRVDEPIVCTVSFKHPRSGNITSAAVAQVFGRAISALLKADGSWRFDDLMRSSERPIAD
jgi:hypothetical protein